MNVDAVGKCCNNVKISFTIDVYNKEETYNDIAVEIYSKYKFVLAIENTIKNGYFTEKLINPILANSIPIYYGSDTAFEIINKNRVIYFNDFQNIDELIEYIIKLSENEEDYNRILNEKIFVNDDLNLDNYNEFINNRLKEIFNNNRLKTNIIESIPTNIIESKPTNINSENKLQKNIMNIKKLNYLKLRNK